MRDTLAVLNDMERAGLFRRYAIGGAIAAIFYMEAFETDDLDILILLPAGASLLAPLSPIYDEARRRGYEEDGPFLLIEGMPVQFLAAYNPLVTEAVEQAREVPYEDVTTRVPAPEHIAAIMVQTGRDKDRTRLRAMKSQVPLDETRLADILGRYDLVARYRAWLDSP